MDSVNKNSKLDTIIPAILLLIVPIILIVVPLVATKRAPVNPDGSTTSNILSYLPQLLFVATMVSLASAITAFWGAVNLKSQRRLLNMFIGIIAVLAMLYSGIVGLIMYGFSNWH